MEKIKKLIHKILFGTDFNLPVASSSYNKKIYIDTPKRVSKTIMPSNLAKNYNELFKR